MNHDRKQTCIGEVPELSGDPGAEATLAQLRHITYAGLYIESVFFAFHLNSVIVKFTAEAAPVAPAAAARPFDLGLEVDIEG